MSFLVRFQKKIWSFKIPLSIALVYFIVVVNTANSQECLNEKFRKSSIESLGMYLPDGESLENPNFRGRFYFNAESGSSGKLIQSFAFNEISCKWIVALSSQRSPELIELWEFPKSQPFINPVGPIVSDIFSHPQDISTERLNGNEVKYWLAGQSKKEIIQFSAFSDSDKTNITRIKRYMLPGKKPKEISIATSFDSKLLVVSETVKDLVESKKIIRRLMKVYDLQKIKTGGFGEALIASWPLDDEQQEKRQWVQGISSIGNTIFVYSGDHSISGKKLLLAYSIKGKLIERNEIKKINNTDGSKTYEPEGLEITSKGNEVYLNYGVATGVKGNRLLTMFSVLLVKK